MELRDWDGPEPAPRALYRGMFFALVVSAAFWVACIALLEATA